MLRQGKENRGAISKQQPTKHVVRNALAPLPVNKRSKSASAVTSPSKKCLLNYPLPLKVTKKTTVTTEEKVFVDAGEYFDLTDKQFPHKISPVKPIRSVSTSTYLVDDDKRVLQKPAIKRTLLHRTARKSHSFYNFYVEDIFYSHYLMETVEHFLTIEWKHVLRTSYIKSDLVSTYNRKLILNRLQRLHKNTLMGPTVYLTAVHLYDRMMAANKIPSYLNNLTAMAILWTVNKLDTSQVIPASKFLKNSGYSTKDLLKLELKVMKFYDCQLLVPDPITFVCYYLKLLNMDTNQFKILVACASFILESFTLHNSFSTFPPSFKAAAATYLSITTLITNFNEWDDLRHYPGYYTRLDIQNLKIIMAQAVKEQQNPRCHCREAYLKYSTAEFGSVSLIYGDKLGS